MNEKLVKKKVDDIIFSILGEKIEKDLHPSQISEWDSLNHLNIVLAIEEEFGIEIPPEEFPEVFKPLDEITKYILKKLNNDGNKSK